MKETNHNQSKPIIVAIIANTVIAISKAIGYFFSGSSALLSETIHSIADVMNQSLLYVGIVKSQKPENETFQYGYSQERFFWNLVSAMGIFVLGCGVTIYHGVHDLLEPTPLKPAGMEQFIIEIILGISLIVEIYSLKVAIGEIQTQAKSRNKKFFHYLNESTDPSVSAVFWEDLAAILGILLALVGIVFTNLFGSKIFDSLASILIGALMGWIAYHLAIENKKFLVDRSIPDYEMRIIEEVLKSSPYVKSYKNCKSIVFGPDRLKLRVEIVLNEKPLLEKLSINKKNAFEIEHFLEIQKNFFKEIEFSLKSRLPELKHVDLVLG